MCCVHTQNIVYIPYTQRRDVRTKQSEMAKQPILKELEYFVNGATAASTINPSGLSHLVHCGFNLLHNLPASKDAVFEYFTIFFDASVAGYVKLMEVSGDVDGGVDVDVDAVNG